MNFQVIESQVIRKIGEIFRKMGRERYSEAEKAAFSWILTVDC